MADTDSHRATVTAEKLRDLIGAIIVPGVERHITVSLGIATIPEHAGDGDQRVRSADRALYAAKTSGRNRTEMALTAGRGGANGAYLHA